MRSAIKSRGNESKRAKMIIKLISSDYPDVLHYFLQEQWHVSKYDVKMDAEAASSMMLEFNLKHSQLRMVN